MDLEFDNWLISLLSYNTGLKGSKDYVTEKKKRVKNIKKMTIDENTHWYILKFLAHKVAFEDEIGDYNPEAVLVDLENTKKKTLFEIAKERKTTVSNLREHNLWLLVGTIPNNKVYPVIVPE